MTPVRQIESASGTQRFTQIVTVARTISIVLHVTSLPTGMTVFIRYARFCSSREKKKKNLGIYTVSIGSLALLHRRLWTLSIVGLLAAHFMSLYVKYCRQHIPDAFPLFLFQGE